MAKQGRETRVLRRKVMARILQKQGNSRALSRRLAFRPRSLAEDRQRYTTSLIAERTAEAYGIETIAQRRAAEEKAEASA